MKTLVGFVILVLMSGCSLFSKSILPDSPAPIQTQTKSGEPVTKIEPPATMERSNVPVGVDPDKVVAHIKDRSSGEEVWVVKEGLIKAPTVYYRSKATAPIKKKPGQQTTGNGQNQPETATAPQPDGLSVDRAKPSKWWLWALGSAIGVLVLVGVAYRYIPFVKPLVGGLNKASEPIADRVGEVAGEVGAGAISVGESFVKRLCRKLKDCLVGIVARIKKRGA